MTLFHRLKKGTSVVAWQCSIRCLIVNCKKVVGLLQRDQYIDLLMLYKKGAIKV